MTTELAMSSSSSSVIWAIRRRPAILVASGSVLRDAGYANRPLIPACFSKGISLPELLSASLLTSTTSRIRQRSADVEEAYTSLHAAFDNSRGRTVTS
ncbi:hypothetical protein NFJ02_34g85230 [Pycnococcus provasolii]